MLLSPAKDRRADANRRPSSASAPHRQRSCRSGGCERFVIFGAALRFNCDITRVPMFAEQLAIGCLIGRLRNRRHRLQNCCHLAVPGSHQECSRHRYAPPPTASQLLRGARARSDLHNKDACHRNGRNAVTKCPPALPHRKGSGEF